MSLLSGLANASRVYDHVSGFLLRENAMLSYFRRLFFINSCNDVLYWLLFIGPVASVW